MKNWHRARSIVCVLAVAVVVSACESQVPTEPAGRTAPRITGVTPQQPMAASVPQQLFVRGERFSTGMELELTTPAGATVTIPPSGLAELEPSSFQVMAVLPMPGSYSLTVRNSSGEVSPPFVLTVLANPDQTQPVIAAVVPSSLTRSTLPQTVTLQGANFAAGLTVSVVDPDGLVGAQSAGAIDNLTATSFQLSMVFSKAGTYSLRVINPSGDASNLANLVVGFQ